MSEIELKPCPFCGGQVKLDEDDFYMFCCEECGAGITFAKEQDGRAEDCSREESIDKWNTRKPVERIVQQLENKMDHSFNQRYKAFAEAVTTVRKGGVE